LRVLSRASAWWKKRLVRTDERGVTEMAVAAHALNRMLELGRPSYVRSA
jgi:hypothetical protein